MGRTNRSDSGEPSQGPIADSFVIWRLVVQITGRWDIDAHAVLAVCVLYAVSITRGITCFQTYAFCYGNPMHEGPGHGQ